MDDIFELKVFEDSELKPIYSESYYELCDVMADYDALLDHQFYSEVVTDNSRGLINSVGKIAGNTVSTTKDVLGAYGTTTDAGGNILKAGWDLLMKLLKLALKAITAVSKVIADIPNSLNRLISHMKNIGKVAENKIHGNISLYITYEDIVFLQKNYILKTFKEILSAGVAMGNDAMWVGLSSNKKGSRKSTDQKVKKFCSQIINHRLKIKGLKFDISTVDLSDERMRKIYFGLSSNGTTTYIGAINSIIADVTDIRDQLDRLADDFNTKYERAISTGAFANFSLSSQKLIQGGLTSLTKSVLDISKIVTYANKDVNTIIKAVNKINKSKNNI